MTQFHLQMGALKALDPVVISLHQMVVFPVRPPVAQAADVLRIGWIVRRDRPALAVSPQVFGGIKTEAADVADASCRATFVFGAVGLRRIFDNYEAVPPPYFQDWIHIGRLAVKMYRKDRLGAWRNGRLDRGRIHVERLRVDI